MIIKMPCVKCKPGTEDNHNIIAVDEDGREPMICGNKPCLEKAYCVLLEKKLVKKEA